MSTNKMVKKLPKINFDGWNFAIINNRLAEIYFEKKKGKRVPWAHAYVKKSEYKTKREQKMIAADTKQCQFTYRNKKYTKKEI